MPTVKSLCVYFWPDGVLRTNTTSAGDLLNARFDMEKLGRFPKAALLNGSEQAKSSLKSTNEGK
jgi:hypothetical protein